MVRLTSIQYQKKTTLKKLDQKDTGEKRFLQRYLEAILRACPVKKTKPREVEMFTDR